MQNKPQYDFNIIQSMMMNVQAFNALMESMRLGVFDTLAAGPATAGQVADKHGFRESPTEALLEMFCAFGLAESTADGYRASGEAAEYLASDSPFFQGQNLELHHRFIQGISDSFAAQMRGEVDTREDVDQGWGLEDSMTGTLQDAMTGPLQDTVAFVTSLGNFSQMRTFCDIGGNHGGFSMAILDRNKQLKGEIADLPHVAAAANQRIEHQGYAGRLHAFACNLDTDALPALRYDLILGSHILYRYLDDLPRLFEMLFAALKPGGWLVAQHLNPDGGLPVRYTSVVEFITRICSYKTHQIAGDTLTTALGAAGFSNFKTAPAGQHQGGLIVAAQKPYASHI